MVTQNTLRTCKRKRSIHICDCCRSKQMPHSDRAADFPPRVRTYFRSTIKYKCPEWPRNKIAKLMKTDLKHEIDKPAFDTFSI